MGKLPVANPTHSAATRFVQGIKAVADDLW